MKVRFAIDRFEGPRRQFAVLLTDDGVQVNFPRSLLPRGVKAGDVFSFDINRDAAATKAVADETRKVQDDLKKNDTGGDIAL